MKGETEMKIKVILMCVMVALLAAVSACSSAVALNVTCDDFVKSQHINKEVAVAVGDSFTVALCSNPSTGFQWSESAQIGEQTILQQTDHQVVPPEAKGNKSPAPGAAGKETWTFKALEKGTTDVSMEYSRPWEGGEKSERTFKLTVTVR